MKTNAFVLTMCLLAVSITGPNQATAQKRLFLKGGPALALGKYNTVGIDAGLEFQLGNKFSLSSTLNYTIGITSDKKIEENAVNNFDNSDYLDNSFGFGLGFRFYTHKNIFYPLEGFFLGIGAEIGSGSFTRSNYYTPGFTKEQRVFVMSGISIGYAKYINEKCCIEINSGLKVALDENEVALIPIQACFKYALN